MTQAGRVSVLSGMAGPARYWIVKMDLDGNYELLYESADTWAWLPIPSPDERRVAFATMRVDEDVWMIEGF